HNRQVDPGVLDMEGPVVVDISIDVGHGEGCHAVPGVGRVEEPLGGDADESQVKSEAHAVTDHENPAAAVRLEVGSVVRPAGHQVPAVPGEGGVERGPGGGELADL